MEEGYVTKYAKARQITEAEALTHEIVKEVAKYYRERGKDAVTIGDTRNENINTNALL